MTFPISLFPYFPIKINKYTRVRAPGDKNLRTFLKDPASKVSDLIVISHDCKAGRRFAVIGVLLPSNKFAEQALIPGNAAGTGDNVDMKALSLQLDNLKGSFNAANEATTVKAMKVASTSAEGQRQRLRGGCEVGPLPGETRDPRAGGRQQPFLQRSAPQGFPATDQAGVLHHHPCSDWGKRCSCWPERNRQGSSRSPSPSGGPQLRRPAGDRNERGAERRHNPAGQLNEPPAGSLFPLRLRPELGPEEQRWLLPPRGRPESHPGTGGIGRNGALKTPEAQDGVLLRADGAYRFMAGKLSQPQRPQSRG
jgi:hypothetical protein